MILKKGFYSLLNWKSDPRKLQNNLTNFSKELGHNGKEFVKLIDGVLDALFEILNNDIGKDCFISWMGKLSVHA